MADFEFLSPTDKPALLGISDPSTLAHCRALLGEMGYKVHVAAGHEDFLTRFAQVQYLVVMIEELFASMMPEENITLQSVQGMPMNQRRHAVILLIGDGFETMHRMQAYQQSVHAVLNRADFGNLEGIIQQAVSENDLFLNTYRESQVRVAQGKG
jgi:hypothetical protein